MDETVKTMDQKSRRQDDVKTVESDLPVARPRAKMDYDKLPERNLWDPILGLHK